jgi:hypothetical protein
MPIVIPGMKEHTFDDLMACFENIDNLRHFSFDRADSDKHFGKLVNACYGSDTPAKQFPENLSLYDFEYL